MARRDYRFSATQAGTLLGELIYDGSISQTDANNSIKRNFSWNPALERLVQKQATETQDRIIMDQDLAGITREYYAIYGPDL